MFFTGQQMFGLKNWEETQLRIWNDPEDVDFVTYREDVEIIL